MRKDNPLNIKPYSTQVKELHLPIKPHTLQHNFAVRKGARRYKKPRIKAMSQKNRVDRVKYGEKHQDKMIYHFWKYIHTSIYKHQQEFIGAVYTANRETSLISQTGILHNHSCKRNQHLNWPNGLTRSHIPGRQFECQDCRINGNVGTELGLVNYERKCIYIHLQQTLICQAATGSSMFHILILIRLLFHLL